MKSLLPIRNIIFSILKARKFLSSRITCRPRKVIFLIFISSIIQIYICQGDHIHIPSKYNVSSFVNPGMKIHRFRQLTNLRVPFILSFRIRFRLHMCPIDIDLFSINDNSNDYYPCTSKPCLHLNISFLLSQNGTFERIIS